MMPGSQDTRERLRVLMTADAVGGVWQYALDLAAGLAPHGARVLLATLGPRPSAEQKHQALKIPGLTLAESDFALEWTAKPWADVDAAGEWLLKLQAAFDPHVIHLNGYSHAALDWRKPVLVAAHSCVYSWWQAVHGSIPGPEWSEYHRRVRTGLAAAGVIVAPSSCMAGELQRIYGVTPEKLRVIHNFSRAPSALEKSKRPVVLAAGRLWDQAKNIALLDRIAPKIDWEIHIAGSERGPENSAPRSQSVRYLGVLPHPHLIRQMDQAAIFAHPALYEPFGLSVLEAARSRCCLVLADIPSLRELWEGAALLIDPRDPDRWIFALNALARDPAKLQEFGRLAHSRASKYRSASPLRKYRGLYRSLIPSSPTAGEAAA